MCLKTLGIKAGGGNNQLFSFFHEMVKASIPSVAGLSHFELSLGICLERNDANLSTVCGPHKISKAAKILVFMTSVNILDRSGMAKDYHLNT